MDSTASRIPLSSAIGDGLILYPASVYVLHWGWTDWMRFEDGSYETRYWRPMDMDVHGHSVLARDVDFFCWKVSNRILKDHPGRGTVYESIKLWFGTIYVMVRPAIRLVMPMDQWLNTGCLPEIPSDEIARSPVQAISMEMG